MTTQLSVAKQIVKDEGSCVHVATCSMCPVVARSSHVIIFGLPVGVESDERNPVYRAAKLKYFKRWVAEHDKGRRQNGWFRCADKMDTLLYTPICHHVQVAHIRKEAQQYLEDEDVQAVYWFDEEADNVLLICHKNQ